MDAMLVFHSHRYSSLSYEDDVETSKPFRLTQIPKKNLFTFLGENKLLLEQYYYFGTAVPCNNKHTQAPGRILHCRRRQVGLAGLVLTIKSTATLVVLLQSIHKKCCTER